jgi:DNA-binding HxlR family transcriptional regulator
MGANGRASNTTRTLSILRLSRKWVLLIVRDIAFLELERFGEFRRNNRGLSPRVLSRRLREMERAGLLRREATGREVRYRLTSQGEDAGLILLAFLQYGLKPHVGPVPSTGGGVRPSELPG